MNYIRLSGIGVACGVMMAGCGRKASAPPARPVAPAAAKPAGRLVPAVVASFERGAGGWRAAPAAVGDASLESPVVVSGGAARGDRWLSEALTVGPGAKRVVNVYGMVPAQDWSRFGQTARAHVRAVPEGARITAQLYLVSTDGTESLGPETPVSGKWETLSWDAGDAVSRVARIGVRWSVTGPWRGKLGLDNVRIGAEDGLSTAYSVVYGPYPSHEKATEAMKALKTSGMDAFPIYEQGWYLNLGTFSTHKAAATEAKRIGERGLKASVLVR